MLTYVLDVGDLADARFVLSPLNETALSLFHLRTAYPRAPHLAQWREESLAQRARFDHATIDALVSPSGKQIPDFLTPIPTSDPRPSFDEHVRLIAQTEPEVARAALAELTTTPSPALEALLTHRDPAAAIADALDCYYRAVIAPIWPTLERILEADVTYRGRELAAGGPARLFESLTPHVAWSRTGELRVDLACSNGSGEFSSDGRGLTLIPSVFVGAVVVAHDPRTAPLHIGYPARGSATLTESAPPVAADALRKLIGAAKADLLVALEEPSAVSELARVLGVSPSAISQSLKVLSANGIVDSARYGRRVLYRRTAIGDALVTRR
ncbi:ArsR/SmtB family transcription factor [Tsukamurella strandjordii]|uniref:Helix-turn-helix domain-containing protein n=1 Tax=Tsukamurella strandjordii TaxID=147577 RepID=A0AA90NBV8_9ACTN|nr:helix-turn-helix domain-containing protein [Tsukamurella strandjordii]MDP0396448.1 helix-turn-helix domain-containing protein [Tsukamurella strandjordii]